MYDLHLHSIYSDGIVTFNDIINSATNIQLSGISITDHDNINGLKENTKLNNSNLVFIPGVEFSVTINKKEVHILGYYIDCYNNKINNIINLAKKYRIERTKLIIDKLKDIGIVITHDELEKYVKKDIISRSHIANLLTKKGIVSSEKEAFEKYLGPNGLVYIEKNSISSKMIIDSIKNAGGVSILAHPGNIKDDSIVLQLIEEGIDGLEIINSKHNLQQIENYYNLSSKYKLIQTCGSDCHGKYISNTKLIGKFTVNENNIERIKYLHQLRINNNKEDL